MSTISDAMKKKRDEGDQPAPETAAPRLVQVEVPKDRTLRNIFLGSVLAAIVLAGIVVGGYLLIHHFSTRAGRTTEPATSSPGAVVEPRHETEAVETTEAPGTPEAGERALPKLTGIFPDPIQPIALLNGRRLKLGGVVDGFTLVAIEEDRVVVEREGTRYELVLE